MKILTFCALLCAPLLLYAQVYSGIVKDNNTNLPIAGASVTLVESNTVVQTSNTGAFSINVNSSEARTLQIDKEGYVFEDLRNVIPNNNISVALRPKIKSAATLRWERYLESCNNYNNPNIPVDPEWDMKWTEQNLTGVFAPNTASSVTRRDPTAVIEHNGKFHVWYTRKISQNSPFPWFSNPNLDGSINVFPWDNADVWHASSTDGYTWTEEGPAVERGVRGSYDDQSVFTPEIFVHENKFYLVYQVVQWPYIERVKNTVGMAVADSPNGPWTKLTEPILRPTDNGIWTAGSNSRLDADNKGDFDSHKVHDPCLVYFKNKFYLYYKGERMGEEKFCGQREIRWGVAIADNPTGPYIKSEYNPITTSGHEVAVWNYNNGIAIIQKLDGPERGSVQFSSDGVNFEMVGKATNVPDALGLFRPGTEGNQPHHGVQWGLAHKYDWGFPGGANYLVRFDVIPPVVPIEPADPPSSNALIIEAESFSNTGNENNNTPGGHDGVNKTNTGINFVNSTDWMDYTVTIPESGEYELIYDISTPSDNAAVQFIVDNTVLAETIIPNNGAWDDYTLLKHKNTLNLAQGTTTIRVRASGTNEWQWNLDKIYLDPTSDLSSNDFKGIHKDIIPFPNPTTDFLEFTNLEGDINFEILNLNGVVLKSGTISNSEKIDLSSLPPSAYIISLKDNQTETAHIVIKQ